MEDIPTAKLFNNLYNVAPEIAKEAHIAYNSLQHFGLQNHKAKVCLVLDCSSSMENPNQFFSSGKVEKLINKVLSIACLFDDDQEIEVIPFGSSCGPISLVSLSNYTNSSDNILRQFGGFQYETNYSLVFKKIKDTYFKGHENVPNGTLMKSDLPVFVIWITDGECNERYKTTTTIEFKWSSYYPIFFKILAFGGKQSSDSINRTKQYLQYLDDMPVKKNESDMQNRHVDNIDTKFIDDPEKLSMDEIFEEYCGWLKEINSMGMLYTNPNVIDNHVSIKDQSRQGSMKPRRKSLFKKVMELFY